MLLLSLITFSTHIDAGYFEKIKNFVGNHRKTGEVLLATSTNAAFTAISTYALPSLQDLSLSAATLLGTVAARNFKNHKYRYLYNGGLSFTLLIASNTIAPEYLVDFPIGINIGVQFLVTNFLLIANDLAKMSGRERGESLFEHLLRTEEDEQPQQPTDVEMQTYEAVADSSPNDSLNSSTQSENSGDSSDNGSSDNDISVEIPNFSIAE